MRHDEREAIALIRESNPIYTNNRTAVWVCRNSSSRATARRSCARSSRERFRCNHLVIEFATFGVT